MFSFIKNKIKRKSAKNSVSNINKAIQTKQRKLRSILSYRNNIHGKEKIRLWNE